jgi:predicted dehydrogenase
MKSDELFATFKAGEKLGGTYISFNAPRYAILIDLFGRKGIIRLDMTNSTVNFLPSTQLSRFGKASDTLRQAAQLTGSTLKNALKIVSRKWVDGHGMCIRLFAESLITNEKPPVTLEEACEVVRILEDAAARVEALQKSVSG